MNMVHVSMLDCVSMLFSFIYKFIKHPLNSCPPPKKKPLSRFMADVQSLDTMSSGLVHNAASAKHPATSNLEAVCYRAEWLERRGMHSTRYYLLIH